MAEQIGTPGSNADTSINGGKTSAPKDKACQFCHQKFTSSSLGRHLDLYIKGKNPKPPDGVHDVDQIRKMRGGITRRQPRVSSWRREGSTPAGTPRAYDRRSPGPESARGNRSPGDDDRSAGRAGQLGKSDRGYHINKPTWESTGVMNIIPPTRRNGDSARSWDGDGDGGRRVDARSRSVSKQTLAKSTFEQKQKLIDALDNAKAAELALRELLGSIRAAKQRIEGPSIFDYDPLTLDFPALCLHCLPPPPTIYQTVPIPTASSWCIQPPGEQQYQALRSHFSAEFRRWRVSCAVATTAPTDDLSYPPPQLFDGLDPAEIARQAEASASELESRISDHVHSAFAHWNSIPPTNRQEIWMLEMARSVGRKSQEIQKLKKDKESNQQETAHLQLQIDELSRLQHPREFKLVSPTTLPVTGELMNHLGELGLKHKSVGFDLMDRQVHLDTAIERAVERWKGVVKEARGTGAGLAAQRTMSGESCPPTAASAPPASSSQTPPSPLIQPPSPQSKSKSQSHTAIQHPNSNPLPDHTRDHASAPPQIASLDDMGSDADADADADMEDDDSYMEMNDTSHVRAPEASMATTTNYRLTNGNGSQQNNNGLESQAQQGYVRIGA